MPSLNNHRLNLNVVLEIMEIRHAHLVKIFESYNKSRIEYCHRFIQNFIDGKPYNLLGGPSTLIDKIHQAIVDGETDISLVKQGLLIAEKSVPGLSSAFLIKLDKLTQGSDKNAVVQQLLEELGIVNVPNKGSVPHVLSFEQPKGIN